MLQACLNGSRGPHEHPALPVTPDDLARAAAEVALVGVDAVHLHVKDARGVDTLDADAVAAALDAVAGAVPDLPVGLTTGAWALPDPRARVAAVRAWGDLTRRPGFASVNWHEDGAAEVTQALLDAGIGVEAGLWTVESARDWSRSKLRDQCQRVLLEVPGGLDEAGLERRTDALLAVAGLTGKGADLTVPVLLHGENSTAWPALRSAARRGLATRIGLEDVLVLPDGSPAASNAALVAAARRELSRPLTRGGWA